MPAYRHLSSDERDRIAVLHAAGHALGLIATALGRSKATISRELRRNACASGHYSPRKADGTYLGRRQRSAVLEHDQRLCAFVTDRLAEGWSPEQIAGWLGTGEEKGLARVCGETIYRFVYRTSQKAAELWRYLSRCHRRRKPMKARPSRDTIKNRVSIHERPATVADRQEAGHWEGDLIICKRNRPVLVLHERKSRVTLAARLAGKSAAKDHRHHAQRVRPDHARSGPSPSPSTTTPPSPPTRRCSPPAA